MRFNKIKTVADFRISGPFEKISGLYFANRQCGLLLKIAALQRTGSFIFFEDNISAAAYSLLKEQLPPEYMTPSVLAGMQRYDEEYKTFFTKTLKAYLAGGGN